MPSTFYLAGPTAAGKSEVAVAVAERIGAEIIGCDAYQVYRGLPILTAQPDRELQRRIPHHLVGTVALTEAFDAAQYVKRAHAAINEVHSRGLHALVAGGSGMYLRALTHGLADLPQADHALRTELDRLSLEDLGLVLQRLDPAYYLQIDKKNPRRLVRALEVCLLTGKTYSELRNEWETNAPNVRGVLISRTRDELHRRISHRVRAMFQEGVIEEVRSAVEIGTTAEKTIGLDSVKRILTGECTEGEALSEIEHATRRYAKRQMTWFRREQWLTPIPIDDGADVRFVADDIASTLLA